MRPTGLLYRPERRKFGWVAAVLAVAALAILVLAPMPTSVPVLAQEPATREEAVAGLLARRAAAVRDGDRDAFLATVDPEAPVAFVEAQARSFAGLAQLPLARYRLEADAEGTGDLSPPGVGAREYGGARTWLPETTQRYRLDGLDDRDALDTLWLTYVERDGEWYVGGDDDLVGVGLDTHRNLWDLGPVAIHRTEHFAVVSHPDRGDRAAHVGGLAEQALGRLRDTWTRPWSERLPIIVPSSTDELETILQSTFDLDNFVAFVVYGADEDEEDAATASRMYLQDENLARYGEEFQIQTLVHELVHAATAGRAGPFVDVWVHEGLADWVARGRPAATALPDGSDGRLPDPYEFRTGGAGTIGTSYAESRSAMARLAADRGIDAPAALLDVLGEDRTAPGSVDHRVGVALQQVAGVDLAGFEAGWRDRG